MFCADLSPYHYTCPTGLPGTRSIGWLDRCEPFPTGRVEKQVLEAIHRLAASPVHLMRGTHACDFCPSSASAAGNGELWVRGANGPIYVAPALLPHYVEAHGYLPPAEFLELFGEVAEALSETDLDVMFDEHARKLATNPSREDILVPYYEFQIHWPDAFADLNEFRQFLALHEKFKSNLASSWLRKTSDSYCVQLECRDPEREFNEIRNRLADSASVPYGYRYRLVYLGEPWTTVAP